MTDAEVELLVKDVAARATAQVIRDVLRIIDNGFQAALLEMENGGTPADPGPAPEVDPPTVSPMFTLLKNTQDQMNSLNSDASDRLQAQTKQLWDGLTFPGVPFNSFGERSLATAETTPG